MKVPDYFFPLVAYRAWQWDAHGLRSLNGEQWVAGRPLAAACRASNVARQVGRVRAVHGAHGAPQMDCTCGVYAAKNLDHLRQSGYDKYGVYGEVYLWGSLVECAFGWRAQFAYPKALYLLSDTLPVTLAEIRSRVQALISYRKDIFISHHGVRIALWRENSGFESAGLDFLMSRGQHWYDRRTREKTPHRGDRIAILGSGIAVVADVDSEQLHTLLENHSVVRIGRRMVVWNEQNLRWEASPRAGFKNPLKREE